MARAHKAPYEGYRQRRFVTPHATLRFRERAAAWLKKEGVLEERAAMLMLDRAISDAVNDKKFEVVLDTSVNLTTQVVDISDPERFPGGAVFALVRRAAEKDAEFTEAVVTILTGDMVAANKRDGSWRRVDGTPFPDGLGHKPLAALAGMKVTPVVKPVKPEEALPRVVPAALPVPPTPPAPAAPAASINEALREAARVLKPFAKDYRGSLHFSPDGFTFHFEQVEPTQGEGELKLEDL